VGSCIVFPPEMRMPAGGRAQFYSRFDYGSGARVVNVMADTGVEAGLAGLAELAGLAGLWRLCGAALFGRLGSRVRAVYSLKAVHSLEKPDHLVKGYFGPGYRESFRGRKSREKWDR